MVNVVFFRLLEAMKRHIAKISLMMVVVMVFTACRKEDEGLVSLNAEITNYVGNSNSKMYVDGERYTHWTTGDQVNINGTERTVSLSDKARITEVAAAASYTAIYPAGIVTGANTVNLPAEQVYSVDGSGNQIIAAPMAAYTNSTTLTFANLCALIRVDVNPQSNNLTMERIIVTSSSVNLCGSGTIDFSGTPTLGTLDGSRTVTLTFDGSTIVSGSTKSFYIYVPQFSSDITVDVQAYDASTDWKYEWKKTHTSASITANSIGAVTAAPNNISKYFFGAGNSESDPFLVYNLNELKRVPKNSATYYKLMNDINCGEESWTPIGNNSGQNSFKGFFDGNSKTITYKIINTSESAANIGFFGYATDATIKNLTVSGSITTNAYVGYSAVGTGSIVGYCNSTSIQNCYSNVSITSTNTSTTNLNVGGIVGYMLSGNISYCFMSSTINGGGKNRVGGIVGYHRDGTIDNCTFEGSVSGGNYVGMIASYVYSSTIEEKITNSHYYVANKDGYNSIRGVGTNSANGKDIAGTVASDKNDLTNYVDGISNDYNVYKSSLTSRISDL